MRTRKCKLAILRIRFAASASAQDNFRMNIGDAIRTLRQDKGATLEAIALEAGTNAGNLSRIERGKQRPTLELVEHIAHALGTSVAEIYTNAEAIRGESPVAGGLPDDIEDLILVRRSFKELNTENRRLAVEFLRMLNRLQKGNVRSNP